MSILMPALARVRKQAKTVLCQSNLKQWGSCYSIYLNENDSRFMVGFVTDQYTNNHPEYYWMEALRPCYRDGDLRLCPAATIPGTELGLSEFGMGGGPYSAWGVSTGAWTPFVAGDYGSYGQNGYCADPITINGEPQGIWGSYDTNFRTGNIKGASSVPLMGADEWIDAWPDSGDEPPEYDAANWNVTDQMGRICINRHDGYVNWLFVDFTVRKIGLKQLWKLKWHRACDTQAGPTREEWPDWMKDFKEYK